MKKKVELPKEEQDDKADAWVAFILITAVVSGAVYWLGTMPY